MKEAVLNMDRNYITKFDFSQLWNWRHVPFSIHYGKEFQDEYHRDLKEYEDAQRKVLFSNTFIEYESCDCSEYGCSHGSWPYNIIVTNGFSRFSIHIDEYDDKITFEFENGKNSMSITKLKNEWMLGCFIDCCKLMDIELLPITINHPS